jgi:hypothetical protein
MTIIIIIVITIIYNNFKHPELTEVLFKVSGCRLTPLFTTLK